MNIPFVDLYAQYLTIRAEVDEAIAAVIKDSAFIRGSRVDVFEQEFAAAVGVKHCISCANGTDALYIAMKGLGIREGDEVITTAHSWISTSETITQAGGRVVFCDTEDRSFTIDPAQIEAKITPRTVGIIPVHLYGHPADMNPILEIARKHHLWVIEDCAQAHMAEYRGRKVGTMGNAATFSFYPGKNLGAMGDAGCLVTSDDQLADWCEMFARHGGKGDHQIEGINSRMDGIQAAILSVKLPHLPKWTSARQRVATTYTTKLSCVSGIRLPVVDPVSTHVYHLFVLRCAKRDELRSYLKGCGIATVLNYPKALPFYPAYSYLGHCPQDFPVAYMHQNEILSLPIFPEMTECQIAYVAEKITQFYV